MEDPVPENISGSKVVQHSVNWNVDVCLLVAAVVVFLVATEFISLFGDKSQEAGERTGGLTG